MECMSGCKEKEKPFPWDGCRCMKPEPPKKVKCMDNEKLKTEFNVLSFAITMLDATKFNFLEASMSDKGDNKLELVVKMKRRER